MKETPHFSDIPGISHDAHLDPPDVVRRKLAAKVSSGELSIEEVEAAKAKLGLPPEETATELAFQLDVSDDMTLDAQQRAHLSARLEKKTTPIEEVERIGDIAKKVGIPPDHP